MGAVAPTRGNSIFSDTNTTKNVTVRVPNGATGYTDTWQYGFKYTNLATTINLTMQYY
jgi:hypothetical protein